MMKIINDYHNIDQNKLEAFVYNHPNGNFFQSTLYFNFIKSLPQYEPISIVVQDDEGNITGSLIAVIQKEKSFIKSKFSRRCIVIGGPILEKDNEKVMDLLLQELVKIVKKRSIYIEFRNLFDLSEYGNIFLKNGFRFREHYNFILQIETVEENFKKLNENRKRQIKKALKNNVEIIVPKDKNEIRDFYIILKKLYSEKVKKPLPEFNFFEEFFLKKNLGKYFLIKNNNRVIGGIMSPIYKDTIYEWYIGGLDQELKNQSPSVMATWAAIEYGAKNGLSYFDFLGAGSPNSDYGVRDFKSKFGGKLVQYGRFLRINNPLLYQIGKWGLKVIKVFK